MRDTRPQVERRDWTLEYVAGRARWHPFRIIDVTLIPIPFEIVRIANIRHIFGAQYARTCSRDKENHNKSHLGRSGSSRIRARQRQSCHIMCQMCSKSREELSSSKEYRMIRTKPCYVKCTLYRLCMYNVRCDDIYLLARAL